MKKIFISLGVVLVFAFYAVLVNHSNNNVVLIAANPSETPTTTTTDPIASTTPEPITIPAPSTTPSPIPIPKPQPTPTPVPKPVNSALKDGSYTGPVTDAFYGNLQVKAIIQNGKLADIAFLAFPNDNGTSKRINNAATPQLAQEAIAAQSANVDVVSGATQTSEAFTQSLAAALTMAKN